jgi:sulfoxide reductase catalytic subunit YedY
MSNIILTPSWQADPRSITQESIYLNRRKFIRMMGLSMPAVYGLGMACNSESGSTEISSTDGYPIQPEVLPDILKAVQNVKYTVPERSVTPYEKATSYNNFYEFTTDKEMVKTLAASLTTRPWQIEIDGLVKEPRVLDLDDILGHFELEERIYRFRCVEAWSMTVPWTGIPLSKVIEWLEPDNKATHVRFTTLNRPEEMPGITSQPWYPWPYYEGLRMDEAMNELAFLVVGMYGRQMPNQNGAPVRVITPWKYGYKSPKSIVRIEFTDSQPGTFWSDLQPDEYPFLSNVDPDKPHPRWSQATEKLIDTGERIETLPYNGYGDWVAKLYA